MPDKAIRSFSTSFFLLLFFILLSPIALHTFTPFAQAAYRDDFPDFAGKLIDQDETWYKNQPYVFDQEIRIVDGAKLTIEPGTHISFKRDQNGSAISFGIFDGLVEAIGTEAKPIVFQRASDGDAFTIQFSDANEDQISVFQYVHFLKGGDEWDVEECLDCQQSFFENFFAHRAMAAQKAGIAALQYWEGRLRIEDSVFMESAFGDVWAYDSRFNDFTDEEGNFWPDPSFLLIRNSDFSGNTVVPAIHIEDFSCQNFSPSCRRKIIFQNNWYASSSGPSIASNSTGTGKQIADAINLNSWSSTPFFCLENCYSNVLFLPGIKASNLYKETPSGDENRLWPPNFFENDLDDLALDGDGESVASVYTRDVLKEVGIPVIGGNIYKSFLASLEELKTAGTISDYQAFAYDWRQNVEDIAKNGTPYAPAAVRSGVADLESLAASSKTGKATIIAHSNGGLLAKAIMLELGASGKSALVDKIVFVGTPQMGTPMAVLSLLYGYEESALFGTLISREDARELAENMPGAYGLLPSETYFDRIEDPFITFTSTRTRYEELKDAYGEGIGDPDEFRDFLSGEGDGRSEPARSEVETENTLRKNLLDQARSMHERLDAWAPPADVEVIQIAGWGLDTVSGVEYTEKEKATCYSAGSSAVPSCTGIDEYEPVYEPKFTVDGDKVVVAPSALMLSEAENVKKYWINLYGYNDPFTTVDRKHKDLFEVDDVRDFLSDIITKTDSALPEFMRDSRPDDYSDASSRIRMSLYSPLDIHLYDEHGNHTGPKTITVDGHEYTIFEEGIPNSYYYQFGERKYVGFGSGEPVRVEMDGYDSGSYTLKLEEVRPTDTGETVVTHTTFEHLPVTPDTEVSLDIPASGITELPALEADINGNATGGEYIVEPVLGGTATLVTDTIAPETTPSLSGNQGANGWYVGDVAVILSATDNEDGDGVEKTEYSLDNGAVWQEYAEAIVFSSEGTATLLYRSSDKAGNLEEEKALEVKIDKTAPEAGISFDPETRTLDIRGIDNLSGEVSVSVAESIILSPTVIPSEVEEPRSWASWLFDHWSKKLKPKKKTFTTATLTDQAGHVTKLVFEKKKDENRHIDLSVISVSYDGAKTDIRNVSFQYEWLFDRWKKSYRLFTSHLRDDGNTLESWYQPKKDETWIMERSRELDDRDDDREINHRPVLTKLSGLVVPYLETKKGDVKIGH